MPDPNFPPQQIGTLRIALAPPLQRWLLQGPVAAIVGQSFGPPLPTRPSQATEAGARAALWLGPDEWLLLAPATDDPSPALATALAATPHSLVDVSQRSTALTIEGPNAAQTLNGAVPLDLHPTAFPVGMCTRTLFEKTGITLWRRSADLFQIDVGRSFLPYVWEMLLLIAAEE